MAFDTDDPSTIDREPSFNQSGVDAPGFLGGHSDFVNWGIYNGAFAKGPPDPSMNIDVTTASGSNFMPAWRFVQSSNTNITAKQVRDTSSPSGSNLRFTFVSGAANDEAFIEQIVPVGGTRFRTFGHVLWATQLRVTATDNGFRGTMALQYLTADGDAVGNATSGLNAFTSNGDVEWGSVAAHAVSGSSPPAAARFLRVRLGVKRNTAANGATGSFDFTDVRLDRAVPFGLIAEQVNPAYSAGWIQQAAGVLSIGPDGLARAKITLGGLLDIVTVTGTTMDVEPPITLTGQAAPSNPVAGSTTIYADTSAVLRTLDSSGQANVGVDALLFPAAQVSSVDVNALDDYEEGTWTPVAAYATPGTSSWAVTTQVGTYTKIGNTVRISFFYQGVPTNGTGSGNMTITGLPFTSLTLTSSVNMLAGNFSGYTKANYTQVSGRIGSGQTIVIFETSGSGQASALLQVGDVPSGGTVNVKFTGVYATET